MTQAQTDEALPKFSLPFDNEQEMMEFFQNFGANGRTYQDFTQLTEESMEVIYMAGYNQYNAGRYQDAEKIFQLLSVLNHFENKYWMALGASREMQKKYEEALKAYTYLGLQDLHAPVAPFHAAKCFIAIGKVAEAESALRAAFINSQGKEQFLDIHKQAEGLLEVLEKNKKVETANPSAF